MKTITLEKGTKIQISEEEYRKLVGKAKKDILVPEDIQFEDECGDGDKLGIVFPNSKQVLAWAEAHGGVYLVEISHSAYFVRCKLVPVSKDELQIGYTYFVTDDEHCEDDIEDLEQYRKYLGDGNWVRIGNDEDVIITDVEWGYVYKVVRV